MRYAEPPGHPVILSELFVGQPAALVVPAVRVRAIAAALPRAADVRTVVRVAARRMRRVPAAPLEIVWMVAVAAHLDVAAVLLAVLLRLVVLRAGLGQAMAAVAVQVRIGDAALVILGVRVAGARILVRALGALV